MTAKQKLSLAVAATLGASALSPGSAFAVTAYADNFNRNTGLNGGTYAYNTVVTAGDGGASIVGDDILTLTNDVGATANAAGIVYTNTPTASYSGGFNNILTNNTGATGLLTWTLNMQQIRTNPSGTGAGNYGQAYVLGATDADFANAGSGYALVVGNTGTADPYRLYKYTNGLAAVMLTANSATAAGAPLLAAAANANLDHWSLKLTFNAETDEWSMFSRNDGAAFADPANPSGYTANGSIVDTTYTGGTNALTYSGAYWAYSTQATQSVKFDNLLLDLSAAPVPATPRELVWDGNGATIPDPSDTAGNWEAAGNWFDASAPGHVNWASINPDNATFGTGGGAGAVTVTLGTDQTAGRITFAANSPNYTLAGPGALTLKGHSFSGAVTGMVADTSATLAANLIVSGAAPQIWAVNGANTVNVNGLMSGSGAILKRGTGTLNLNQTNAAFSGGISVEGGTLRVSTLDSGRTGWGTGVVGVHNATLHIDASTAPSQTIHLTTNSGTMVLGDDSILKITNTVIWQKNFPEVWSFDNLAPIEDPVDANIHVESGGIFDLRAQLRNTHNSATTASNATVHLTGPGVVKLNNGGAGDPIIYAGSWDVSNGMLVLGQQVNDLALNVLGFKAGNQADANTVTVRNTGILVGTEDTAINETAPFYRSPIVLSGGGLASGDGKDAKFGGHLTVSGGFTSKVYTYDPRNPTVARSVNLVAGTGDAFGAWVQGDTTWAGNLLVDAGATTGGAFNITRDGGTIAVEPGATIEVTPGATLNLNATVDALSDGADHVNVVNNSTTSFNVGGGGTKNVGNVGGIGNTTVVSGTTLIANHVRQNALNVQGNATIRANSAAAGVSKVASLTVGASSKLDLKDNKLITGNPLGTWNGSAYTDLSGLVDSGRGNASNAQWDGFGIVTSDTRAVNNNDLVSIGTAKVGAIKGIADTATSTFAGQTVLGSDSIAMVTWGGDANLDGKINIDDYGQIDFNVSSSGSVFGWFNGDFNYDGKINIDDYGIIDFNVTAQDSIFPTAGGAGLDGVAAVPEPASIGLIGLAATGLLARRRRLAR